MQMILWLTITFRLVAKAEKHSLLDNRTALYSTVSVCREKTQNTFQQIYQQRKYSIPSVLRCVICVPYCMSLQGAHHYSKHER